MSLTIVGLSKMYHVSAFEIFYQQPSDEKLKILFLIIGTTESDSLNRKSVLDGKVKNVLSVRIIGFICMTNEYNITINRIAINSKKPLAITILNM